MQRLFRPDRFENKKSSAARFWSLALAFTPSSLAA